MSLSEEIKISEEIEMNLSKAWEIFHKFNDFVITRKIPLLLEYESNLPYSKEVILVALLKILRDEKRELFKKYGNVTLQDYIGSLIINLANIILGEEAYRRRLETRRRWLEKKKK